MRNVNTLVLLLLTVSILMLPLFALPKQQKGEKVKDTAAGLVATTESAAKDASANADSKSAATEIQTGKVRLYNAETKKITKVDMYDYIYGVVAGECPMLYNDEAIKAQIVAAHTYTLHCMEANSKEKYDVSTNPETSQCYIDKKTALTNWGSSAKKYDEKLNKLLKEVMEYVVLYNSKPILAAYHAISAGKTESAENVWGQKLGYLVPVECVGDKLSESFLSEKSVTFAVAEKALMADGITASQLGAAKLTKTESGNVLKADCGGKEITGNRICAIFGLRSCNFDISVAKGIIKFTVRGYGHQVGMSQNGANYMAKSGDDYVAILKHFYTGTTIGKIKN